VIVPVGRNGDAEAAGRTAERFVRALFGVLPRFPQFRANQREAGLAPLSSFSARWMS